MSNAGDARVPLRCRLAIRIAGWIVPGAKRAEWLREWNTEATHAWLFYREGGASRREAAALVFAFCRGAVNDAISLRALDFSVPPAIFHGLRHPAFCLGVVAIVSVVLAGATLDVRRLAALAQPLPYAHAEQLVLVTRSGPLLGQKQGTPVWTFNEWQSHAGQGIEVTDYSWTPGWLSHVRGAAPAGRESRAGERRGSASGPMIPVLEGRVGVNFFQLLGANPAAGRLFTANDSGPNPRPVVLSHTLWRREFQADPAAIGRRILLDGRYAQVVGVLPGEFWFLSREIELWTVSERGAANFVAWPPLFGVLARIPPAVSRREALTRFNDLLHNRPNPGWRETQLTPLVDALSLPRYPGYTVFVVFLLVSVLIVFLQALAMRLGPSRVSPGQAARYAVFFFAKCVLPLAAFLAVFLHLSFDTPLSMLGSAPFAAVAFQAWLLFLASAAVVWWAWRDQRVRCRLCLARLSMPATIGLTSSSLFEPAVTELLCDRGHGALYVPDAQTSSRGDSWWVSLDRSWRELFSPSKHLP